MPCPRVAFLLVPLLLLVSQTLTAHDHETQIRQLLDSEIRDWLNNPMILEALRKQNEQHKSLTQEEIGRLDEQWRYETISANRPLIDSLLAKRASRTLRNLKERSRGLYTEIFLVDNRGLNVAQSDVTSDYWQGDEPKWQETFLVGPGAVFIDEVQEDESTQQFQSQVSLSISDPDTGIAIGSITFGINVDTLL